MPHHQSSYPVYGNVPGYPGYREPPAHPAARRGSSGTILGLPKWAVAGLAVAAVGVLAWRSFGPDLRRYMKIRSM